MEIPMKNCIVFAALATASFAAMPADAHGRAAACHHASHRPTVHRAVAYHAVRSRAPVRRLAGYSTHHNLRYAGCGCGHAARTRIVYEEPEFLALPRRPHFSSVAYFRPRPIYYRPRMEYYEDRFPIRRFDRDAGYDGGFGYSYMHHRDRYERRNF